MDLNLSPLAAQCCATGQPFAEGQRVVSMLGRDATGAVVRCDLLAEAEAKFDPPPFLFCRWVQVYKPRARLEDPDRALKLTAENLFLTLADPANEPDSTNVPLLQFLALLLERKRILRPKGRTADGARSVYEHARTKQLLEIPAGELTPEFFVRVQAQLGALVGEPKPKTAPAPADPAETAPGPG